jgi:murein DD-endopeptidase MepM/ murein hydrolase activator NlpD
MSFQELDLKSSRITTIRRPFVLAFKSKLQIKLLLKLTVASAAVTLLGFSASSWEPTALSEVVDSTPKPPQLHYKLPLPNSKFANIEPEVKVVSTKVKLVKLETTAIKAVGSEVKLVKLEAAAVKAVSTEVKLVKPEAVAVKAVSTEVKLVKLEAMAVKAVSTEVKLVKLEAMAVKAVSTEVKLVKPEAIAVKAVSTEVKLVKLEAIAVKAVSTEVKLVKPEAMAVKAVSTEVKLVKLVAIAVKAVSTEVKLVKPEAMAVKAEVKIVKAKVAIENHDWKIITIKSGDTLAAIFSANGLSATTTHNVSALNDHTKALRYIKPGQKVHLLLDEQKSLRQMKYVYDTTKTLEIRLNEDQSLTSQIINYKLDARPVFRQGIIKSSLFEAAAAGDIPESVIMDLANIFGWDIDFSLDIRRGDQFGVAYNELYKDGVKIKSGQILAAEFINNGKLYKAVYYTNPKGEGDYYDEDGKSMRKAFLRSPVKFARVSSKFSLKRWHPVLAKWRSHKGVDYAARRGTPIRASGDGKIVLAGRKGGYGKAIFIQHGGRYRTVYGHLNSYAKGIRVGKKVKQGQIIGYVGSTGLATGPHLHYEFRVNGTHRNPLTVRLPEAVPVHPSNLPHFKENTQVYLSMLQVIEKTLAANSN